MEKESHLTESDPRFPSGAWRGYFLYRHSKRRFATELHLHFASGQMSGEGIDLVGSFSISGRYDLEVGLCEWIKTYHGRHTVDYRGYNEGKGIWGSWKIISQGEIYCGGFHIWPEGLVDLTSLRETEEIEVSLEIIPPKRRRRRRIPHRQMT